MERLKQVNWPYALAIVLLARGIYEFSFGQAALALVVFSYLGYDKWIKHTADKDLAEKLAKLEEATKQVELVKQEVTELRTNLSGLMIKNASRPQDMKQAMEGRRFF